MSHEVNYEVQVQQGGRWSIHARFTGDQKDDAINEGRELDKLSNVDAVKVIKEVYDREREIHSEFIVYKSAAMRGKAADQPMEAKPAQAPAQKNETWLDRVDEEGEIDTAPSPKRAGKGRGKKQKKKKKDKKKGSSITSILVKLLMVLLFSVCISAVMAVIASEGLSGANVFGIRIVGNAESNLLIGVFIITFLVSAVGMSVKLMSGESLEEVQRRRLQARQDRLAKQAMARALKAKEQKQAEKAAAPTSAAGPSMEAEAKTGETLTQLEDAMQGVGQAKVETPEETKAQADKAQANAEVTDRLRAELHGDKEPGAPSVAVQAQPAPAVAPLSEAAEAQKTYVMNFLSKALEGVQGEGQTLDNFNKFGVNLYLAGACEVLAQKRDLGVRDRSRIITDGVQVMGFKRSHAESFADRYEEYLMADSRYMQMFQAGRNAMNICMSDEDQSPRLLQNAIDEWNKPKPKEEQTGPITVLFTDIAGSTAMTQALGDAGAQQVVRAHNRVVREALSANAGKEIKHTGDGIMASFAKTSDGVDAAIQMQRETMVHNLNNPDLPLHLKIGLNAGEPIAEDNDLFGSTVQLSARIVDKASADEIFVSEIVRGICAGKSYKFVNKGGFPMKGFGDDVTLYEVVWDDDADGVPAGGGERNFAPSAAQTAPGE